MAEVLMEFDEQLSTGEGFMYSAQACAAPNGDGLWEAWIEFLPIDGGPPLRSPRETTQPNRIDAEYWATGLSPTYLEGALGRARNPIMRKTAGPPKALFDEPAPNVVTIREVPAVEAVMDPFSVYEKGARILRQELGALAEWHLVNIILAYQLSEEPVDVLNRMSASTLVDLIVARVRENAAGG